MRTVVRLTRLGHAFDQLDEQPMTLRPWAVTGGSVEMAGLTRINQIAPPTLRHRPCMGKFDVFVGMAGHDDARKREPGAGQRPPRSQLRNTVEPVDIRRRDEKRADNPLSRRVEG